MQKGGGLTLSSLNAVGAMEPHKLGKPEITAPAGSLDKLLFAVYFGADAVYFGGSAFNLRINADGFTNDELSYAAEFCSEHGVKSIFLLNAFLHEKNLSEAKSVVRHIKGFGFDAVMTADPGMLVLLKDAGVHAAFYLSTQMTVLNSAAAAFWKAAGYSRVVLGREITPDEILAIKNAVNIEIEVFAHGAVCMAYSGRCLLSRCLTGRDANAGDCSQPCRWRYKLVEEKRQGTFMEIGEYPTGTEILSAYDLCLIEKLPDYIRAGVDAFKIEGRMKSLYHAANTTRIYAAARDAADTPKFSEQLEFWRRELDLVSHRPYTSNTLNETEGKDFAGVPYINKAMFMGWKLDAGDDYRAAKVKTANPIYAGDVLDAIFPIKEKLLDDSFRVVKIIDEAGAEVNMARPNGVYTIIFDKDVAPYAVFRKTVNKQEQ